MYSNHIGRRTPGPTRSYRHQLAYTLRDPNGRVYNWTSHNDECRKMMLIWADYLDGLKSGKNDSLELSNIVFRLRAGLPSGYLLHLNNRHEESDIFQKAYSEQQHFRFDPFG